MFEQINPIVLLALITLIPFLELRASIPYGIFILNMHWLPVLIICFLANIILGPIVFIFVDKFVYIFLKINFIEKLYLKWVEKTQHKIRKIVDKWGNIGVALFIGIPLPGSGVYSGALGAYVIGLGFRKFVIAQTLGVLIAAIIVTIVSITGSELFGMFLKII